MQKITSKQIYILIFLLISASCAILYFHKTPTPKQTSIIFKCPENYAETDAGTTAYRNALIAWTTSFFETNPNATISDWSIAKTKLWMDNNCTVAIERSKMSGAVADLKPWEKVDYEVQNTIDKALNSTN